MLTILLLVVARWCSSGALHYWVTNHPFESLGWDKNIRTSSLSYTVPDLLRAFSSVLTSASDFLVLLSTARVPVKKWALHKRIQKLTVNTRKWRQNLFQKLICLLFYLEQKINKIITINNFYWNTWKFHWNTWKFHCNTWKVHSTLSTTKKWALHKRIQKLNFFNTVNTRKRVENSLEN
jgi:hypothetical protein